jgi:Tol biopolymer transport system component
MPRLRALPAFLITALLLLTAQASGAATDGNVWVSLRTDGNQIPAASGAYSYPPSVSSDGNYVAFQTLGPVSPNRDVRALGDVLRRDIGQSSSVIVSVSTDGTPANGRSYAPAISADGSLVVFESIASNLVAGDNNNGSDIYLRDLTASTTTRVSVSGDGADANSASYRPSISGDGAFVAFCSRASNLVAGDQDNSSDLFLWQRSTTSLTRVTVAGTSSGPLDGCERTAIDDDGGVVAFSALTAGQSNVYTYDRAHSATTPVTSAADGSSGMSGLAISGDGKLVAFDSMATNLIAGDSNRSRDVFVRNVGANSTARASVRSDGSQLPADSGTSGVGISRDGRFVVFGSTAEGVVPGDSNGSEDVFRRELATGKTTIVSVSATGRPEDGPSYAPAANSDGSAVAFTSLATDIVSADSNSTPDVFLRGGEFPERLGNSSGPEDTGAPPDIAAPVTSNDTGGVPLAAFLVGGVAILVLVGGWFLLGRRGTA